MFITDTGGGRWKFPPKIERASMDGAMRVVLVTDRLVAPVGISLDYVNQRVYWSDANLDHIQSVSYSGQHR